MRTQDGALHGNDRYPARPRCNRRTGPITKRLVGRAGDAHLLIMTSEALITAAALSPTFRPSSSTASLVMDDVNVMP